MLGQEIAFESWVPSNYGVVLGAGSQLVSHEYYYSITHVVATPRHPSVLVARRSPSTCDDDDFLRVVPDGRQLVGSTRRSLSAFAAPSSCSR